MTAKGDVVLDMSGTHVSHSVLLGDMFLHYDEHTLKFILTQSHTHVLLTQILTRAPNMD